MTVPRYLSMSSSIHPGSKRGRTTWVPSVCTSPRVISPHPATWKYGIGLTSTSPARRPMASAASRALLVSPRWVSTAALGRPVVPEVYRICAGPAGSTSGSGPPSPDGHSPSVITSRSRGSRSRTPARIAACAPPRRNTPRAPECPSTCASSSAWYAGLTVTSVSPASPAANSSSTQSGPLPAQTATGSPGANRVRSPRATRSASSRSSP